MAMSASDDEFDIISNGELSSVPSLALSDEDILELLSSSLECDSNMYMPERGDGWEGDDDDDVPSLQSVSGSKSDSEDGGDDNNNVPDLEGASDSGDEDEEDDGDGFERIYTPSSWLVNALNNGDKAYTSHTMATLTNQQSLIDMDLYDSGATCHMSGYHHQFTNFIEIEPKPITAADKH
ncbi:hypothetical protein CVT25_001161 [Psilocybe cyanescens]|uniref:Uncharacterized protein n=1 Tax=Psilocybe cyanescens TaxID=93625 RepID=A0A409XEI1_PSICY|nr:hypothetical protein CVT25_001161 [Psilocybe cyanescens]